MHVLLVQEDEQARQTTSLILESKNKAFVSGVSNAQAALDRLLDDARIDLIICEDDHKAMKLMKYLMSSSSKIPCILVIKPGVESVPAFPELVLGTVGSKDLAQELQEVITKGIATGRIVLGTDGAVHVRIKPELLVRVSPLRADVYIRLSSVKFVKLFKTGDSFSGEDLDKYLRQKKVEFLYILKGDAGELISKLRTDVATQLESKSLPQNKAREMSVTIHEAVHEMTNVLGFTEEVQEVAKQGIAMTLKSIGAAPTLKSMLGLLNRDTDPERYIATHSMFLAEVACSFSVAMRWASDSTFQKLSYAAFFHDITMTSQKLARFNTIEELTLSSIPTTPDDIARFRNHPNAAVELVRQCEEVPADVETIIVQHHERPDGTGFPRGSTASFISPLACVFILAHDFVDYVFDKGKDASFETFLEQAEDKNMGGNFTKLIDNLKATRDKTKRPSGRA